MNRITVGRIFIFAGEQEPVGYRFCNGIELKIADFPGLYELIGTTFGGDGITTFKLPDLPEIETDPSPGRPEMVKYVIGVEGNLSDQGAGGQLGRVSLFAGKGRIINGWHPCDGSTLNVSEYTSFLKVLPLNGSFDSAEGNTFTLPVIPPPDENLQYYIKISEPATEGNDPLSDEETGLREDWVGMMDKTIPLPDSTNNDNWMFCPYNTVAPVDRYPVLLQVLWNKFGGDNLRYIGLPYFEPESFLNPFPYYLKYILCVKGDNPYASI